MTNVQLELGAEDLRPLIKQIVPEVIKEIQEQELRVGIRLAFTEQEAAELLALNKHQLRDERRRGRITASQIVGRRIRYTRDDLLDYLHSRRYEADA